MRQNIYAALASLLFIAWVQVAGAQTTTTTPAPTGTSPRYEDLTKPATPPATPPRTTAPSTTGTTTTTTTTTVTSPPPGGADEGLYLNAIDTDIREIIKQISKATGKNFLIDDKVRGKVTILSEKKMTTEEAYQAFLSALEVLGFTVVSGPGDLVKIIPLKNAITSPLPIYKDDSPFTDSYITRLVSFKNVSALDMANAIKPLVSKEGNLFAYPSTNTLIITDSGTNIDRILKILKEMDTQGPEQMIEMYTIKNASAKDVADKLQKVYVDQAGATPARRPAAAGARGPEMDDIPFISKVIADERTNAVIVLAAKRALPKVRDLIARLDRPLEGPQGKLHVHYLKHAEAAKMAQVLSTLTSGTAARPAGAAPGAPGAPGAPAGGRGAAALGATGPVTAEFEGGVKIAADESTNSLIITSTQKDYETLIAEVVNKLDIPRRQVYVEVVIMELTIDKDREIGVRGQGGGTFNINGTPVIGFGSSLGGTAAALPAALAGAGAAGVLSQNTISFPRTNADGTVTNVNIPSFGAILTALQVDQNVNILSTPNLLTLDNEEAEIIVGGEEPFPTGTTLTTGGNTTFNVTRQNVGITLKITPQVNEGDMVKMKLKQEVTSVVPGASETVLTTVGPSTTKRSVETVVVAKDQQTIVIGGLIDDKTTITESKIPFLGDIPLLGYLFKNKKRTKAKTNILVFLRPYIIRDTADFLKILQKKVEERNMFIEQNYGRTQQKMIRESIRSHAAELLEFKKDIQLQEYQFERVGTPAPAPQSRLNEVGSTPEPVAATESPPPSSQKSSKSKVNEKNL